MITVVNPEYYCSYRIISFTRITLHNLFKGLVFLKAIGIITSESFVEVMMLLHYNHFMNTCSVGLSLKEVTHIDRQYISHMCEKILLFPF